MPELTRRRGRFAATVAALAGLAALVAPTAAFADLAPTDDVQINAFFALFAACLVLFMQAGFATLEIGMSRQKNVGAVSGKIIVNLSLAFIVFYFFGYALGFGNGGDYIGLFGDKGVDVGGAAWASGLGSLMLAGGQDAVMKSQTTLAANLPTSVFFFFQVAFAAVSLAIVWGTTLDRTKFGVYCVFAVVFVGFIYPTAAHWSWGGGWLAGMGFADFAGSTNVHLQGAAAGLAATVLLGPRIGKYRKDGTGTAIPGHNMPLVILGVLILWLGWMGFNGGSFLAVTNGGGEIVGNIMLNTNLAAAAGVIGALLAGLIFYRTLDVGIMGNGAIAGLVAITAGCFFVDNWAAPIIGAVAGFIMVPVILGFDKVKIDDPVGALAAHGAAGIWGTVAVGLFLVQGSNAARPDREGLLVGGNFDQLGVQVTGFASVLAFTFGLSFLTFLAIKYTIGLRVSRDEEMNGLDISEHGQFGYPESFIDVPGAIPEGLAPPPVRVPAGVHAGAHSPTPATPAMPAGTGGDLR